MRVVILGCGRLGAKLAEQLDRHGHDVTILARDTEGFSRLPKTFSGRSSVANLIDIDDLRSHGVKGADALIALTDGDNTNVMACQIAKHILGVPTVISQIKDPEREDMYNTLGIQTICPTRLGADKIREGIATG